MTETKGTYMAYRNSIHTGRNNWPLKWFQVRLKRCILDGRGEKS